MRARDFVRLKAVAHHEAGHAVAAWQLDLRFKHISIEPNSNEGTLGHVLFGCWPRWFNPEIENSNRQHLYLQRCLVRGFAGQIAEARFRGRSPRYGAESDNQNAVEMAYRLGGSRKTTEAYLHYCWCASEDLVKMRWREIAALATALLDRKTLTYTDAIEVVSPGSAELRASLKAKKSAARKKGA